MRRVRSERAEVWKSMVILDPLMYCFHGQHCMPRAGFRFFPGLKAKRAVCAECYAKIMAERMQKEAVRPYRIR